MRKVGCCEWTRPETSGVAAREPVGEGVVSAVMAMGACHDMASSFHELRGPRRVCLI